MSPEESIHLRHPLQKVIHAAVNDQFSRFSASQMRPWLVANAVAFGLPSRVSTLPPQV